MAYPRTTIYHYVLTIIVTILWGFNFVFAKAALQHFEPFTLLVLRFILVAILLFPFFPKPPISVWRIFAITFAFTIGHLVTMFWSLNNGLDASVGIVTLQMNAPFLLLLAVVFFKEKIGWRSIAGIIIAITGSIILMETPNSIAHPVAFWMMVVSAFASAVYSAQLKTVKDVNVVALITWIAILSIPMLLPFALLFEESHIDMILTADIAAIGSLLYITIGASIIAHSLWAYLLARNLIKSIAPITLLVPVIGILGGVLFLEEALSIAMIMGAILMIIGVGIVVIRRPKIAEIEIEG